MGIKGSGFATLKTIVDALDEHGAIDSDRLSAVTKLGLTCLYRNVLLLEENGLLTRSIPPTPKGQRRRVLYCRTTKLLVAEPEPNPDAIPPYHPLDALFGRYA